MTEETRDQQTRREQDLEQSEQEEETLKELVDENLGHEEVVWPFMNVGDMERYAFWNIMCFLVNIVLIPTGFTYHLERFETHDGLVCHRWIQQ